MFIPLDFTRKVQLVLNLIFFLPEQNIMVPKRRKLEKKNKKKERAKFLLYHDDYTPPSAPMPHHSPPLPPLKLVLCEKCAVFIVIRTNMIYCAYIVHIRRIGISILHFSLAFSMWTCAHVYVYVVPIRDRNIYTKRSGKEMKIIDGDFITQYASLAFFCREILFFWHCSFSSCLIFGAVSKCTLNAPFRSVAFRFS